jgi:F-type H+-transporting ATPase subunit b
MTMRQLFQRVVVLTCFLTLFFLCARSAQATARAAGSTPIMVAQSTSPGQTIVRESREASGEDDKAQFKKSAAVRFVAKLTGGLESAYWLCVLVNFGVIAGLIAWFSRKSLPGFFRDRTASIQKAMEEARRASAEANARLSDIEKRLAHLDDEISAMRTAAETEAAAEEQRIKAATVEEAHKIAEAAGQEIVNATKTARRELTAYAADLAVALASKQMRIDTATDEGLVRRFADQLSNGTAGSGKGGR